ncbi:MAG: hypothetical protein JNN12_06300 [Bacteroidetes Order II. Incertae sedis bacterium]|nr:hypothetical protein [Bacteroidetes Order II. bacterium]
MRIISKFVLTFFVFMLVGCGSEAEKTVQETTPAVQDLQSAAKEAQKALEGLSATQNGDGKTQNVDPIPFKDLQSVLPASVAGAAQSDLEGEKVGMMGFNISNAGARYENGDKSISIKITDTGNMKGFAMLGFAWINNNFEREDANGYERTTKINGNPSLEKYNQTNQDGEVSSLIGGRFVVTVDGRKVTAEELKAALASVNTSQLVGWKDRGVQ